MLFGSQGSRDNTRARLSPIKKALSCPAEHAKPGTTISGSLANLKRSFSSAFAKNSEDGSPSSPSKMNKQRKLDGFILKTNKKADSVEDSYRPAADGLNNDGISSSNTEEIEYMSDPIKFDNIIADNASSFNTEERMSVMPLFSKEHLSTERGKAECEIKEDLILPSVDDDVSQEITKDQDYSDPSVHSEPYCDSNSNIKLTLENHETLNFKNEARTEVESVDDNISVKITEYDEDQLVKRKSVEVPFSILKLQENLKRRGKQSKQIKERTNKFHAKISPSDNQAAENELRRRLNIYVTSIEQDLR